MLLIDNVVFLKERYPDVWDIVKRNEAGDYPDIIKLEESKDNNYTLSAKAEHGWNYLHSKYSPKKEAEQWVERFEDIDNYKHVFFYGIGLGYHIEAFLKKYPTKNYYLYEPNISVFKKYLSTKNIREIASKGLQYLYTEENDNDREKNLRHFIGKVKDDVKIISLPSYERVFEVQTREFNTRFSELIFERRKYNYGAVMFAKRTTISTIKNLVYNYKTPNILNEKSKVFLDKPAILVAAGPALDYEFENLRYIKEKQLAYIFSVGTAINALIEKGIYPDAACTYDASDRNAGVFQKVKDNNIKDIPLLYGSTVGYETLENYPGPLQHFIVSRDFVSPQYLKRKDGEAIDAVIAAESIATITLQLLHKLGCNPVILVGQNLAYSKDRWYADGSKEHVNVTEDMQKKAIIVKDVQGNDIYTIKGFNSFRIEMEQHLRKLKGLEVINTTKGGAHIEGAPFVPLEELIEKRLTKPNIVDNSWVYKHSVTYDNKFFQDKTLVINMEQSKLEQIFKAFKRILRQMEEAIVTRNMREIEKLFNRFDKTFDALQSNKYYQLFILVINHWQFDALMKFFEDVRFQKDIYTKARLVIDEFSSYLDNCIANYDEINPMLKEVHSAILHDAVSSQ